MFLIIVLSYKKIKIHITAKQKQIKFLNSQREAKVLNFIKVLEKVQFKTKVMLIYSLDYFKHFINKLLINILFFALEYQIQEKIISNSDYLLESNS